MNSRDIGRLLQPIWTAIRLVASRGAVVRTDDSQGLQRLQVTALVDETADGVERFHDFGFFSVPLPGADAVFVSIGGSREHLVAVKVDDGRHRPTGHKGGESGVFNAHGALIELLEGGKIRITAPGEVEVVAPKATFSGDVQIDGNLNVDGTLTHQNVDVGKDHTHSGVVSGGSNTGGVVP